MRPLTLAIPVLVQLTGLLGCSGGEETEPAQVCQPGALACSVYSEFYLQCRDDGSGWDAANCPDGTICFEGACQEMACAPGSQECQEGGVATCLDDGSGWDAPVDCGSGAFCFEGACLEVLCVPGSQECQESGVATCLDDGSGWGAPVACEDGTACLEGECRAVTCEPGSLRCRDDGGGVERCDGSGTAWEAFASCPDGSRCFDGVCLPEPCEPGQTECGPETLYRCDESGQWSGQACPEGQPCVFGRCVECLGPGTCAEGEICQDGECQREAPRIVTETLPAATTGAPYELTLEAAGGAGPYTWTLVGGELPAGLLLAYDGVITGVPEGPQVSSLTIQVSDVYTLTATRDYTLEVLDAHGPLTITTHSLPDAHHGFPYSSALAATGGEPPYAWQVLEGALPEGLGLGSDGAIEGTPLQIGTFPVTFRVLDSLTPPGYATRALELTVRVSPLEIVGETEYDLLITKVIVLPILIPLIPYSTALQAQGGVTPYTWAEVPAPDGVSWLIPDWGLPGDLTLGPGGQVSGWVTDTSDAQTITIPFGPELAGYFFFARVTDSQDPADEDEAIFCIPTIAL